MRFAAARGMIRGLTDRWYIEPGIGIGTGIGHQVSTFIDFLVFPLHSRLLNIIFFVISLLQSIMSRYIYLLYSILANHPYNMALTFLETV